MTVIALLLGFALPAIDSMIGGDWTRSLGFIRATQVDGARAILTTLAGATLGVAGVAFSITIVAVSFASSNYGPRLIGNFMADRTNQIVLGVFVATFVYCITVLSTVHARLELSESTLEAFVPQISVLFAIVLTLASVGALIGYIHHIPESINIMNLAAKIGTKLISSLTSMLEDEERRDRSESARSDLSAWRRHPRRDDADVVVRSERPGYLQRIDLDTLDEVAGRCDLEITLNRSPGDFLAVREPVMTVASLAPLDDEALGELRKCYNLGSSRTDHQDVLFLSDQLVEVLGRALSPGVNDPDTAMLCLDWLRAGLEAFAHSASSQPRAPGDRVLYRRITFEMMLDRSFDRMRQYVTTDRTVTIHAARVLASIAATASRDTMAAACLRQLDHLHRSAEEQLTETLAIEEVAAAIAAARREIAAAHPSVGHPHGQDRSAPLDARPRELAATSGS